MDLKKKIGEFFTLTKRRDHGFTLVELIVVIAILGILAGVGTVAYTGYVTRANKAADDTLIAAINRAAATAVLDEMGADMKTLNDGDLSSNAVKGKPGISVWKRYDENGPVKVAFAEYFGDSGNSALKWYGSLKFKDGHFVGVESIMKAGLVVNNTVKDTFNASSYKELGVEGMTEMVDTLAGALSEYGGLSSLTETTAFEETLRKLGIDPDTADAQTKANASVFYLADYIDQIGQKTYTVNGVTKTGDQMLWEQMKAGTLQSWLVNEAGVGLSGNDATFFSTALQYASATAYAHTENASEAAKEIRNANPTSNAAALAIVGRVTGKDTGNALDKAKYNAYVGSKGQSDFYAFFEVMEVVSASKGSFSTFEGSGYFSNEELRAAINGILSDE